MIKVAPCAHCKCEVWLPHELQEVALRIPGTSFYCAYGHKQHYPEEGVRKYWAKQAAIKLLELPDMTNVVQFKGKINEKERHS